MSDEPLRRVFTVSNPSGLHMRPMSQFVEVAAKYQSTVHVSKKDRERINGKSMIELLGLAAEQGTELCVEACGPDAAEALDALIAILEKASAEDS